MANNARWIWTPLREYVNQHLYLRKEFELPSPPLKAVIKVTAETRYRLFVNGKTVLRGPARGFPESLPVDEIDILPFLQAGKNVIGAHVLSFGISTAQNVFKDRAGFYLEGGVSCANHPLVDLATSHTWRFCESTGYRRFVSRSGSQMGYQEIYDAPRNLAALPFRKDTPLNDNAGKNSEYQDWMLPGYDDAGWQKPHVLGAAGVLPWRSFQPRGIPHLKTALVLPARIAGEWESPDLLNVATTDETCNVLDIIAKEKRSPASVRCFEHPEALLGNSGLARVLPSPSERCSALAVDFQETRFGYPLIKISGAAGGEVFDLVYDEQLCESGIDVKRGDPLATNENSLADRLICKTGNNSFETLQARGFRYLMLVARNIRQPVTVQLLGMNEVSYPVEQKGSFNCSDPKLNMIWETGVRTLRHCMADTFMDCPSRSQEQGWAAARVAAQTSFYVYGDGQLYKRGLHLMAQSMLPDGLLLGVVPSERPDCVLPDYCLHWICSLYEYYMFTGDITVLKQHRMSLEKVLGFFAVHAGERGLLGPVPNFPMFLDWAAGLDRANLSATFNLLYLHALRSAAAIGRALEDSGLASHCTRHADSLRDRISMVFASSQHSLLVESVDLRTGEPSDLVSQHATALAVMEGILGKRVSDRSGPVKEVLSDFAKPPCGEVMPGPVRANLYFRGFVHEALSELALDEIAVDDIRRTWGYMLDQGSATWWERMPLKTGSSRCHCWSTHPTSFLSKHVLGLSPIEAGWLRFRVDPQACGLNFAAGKVPTPHGEIEINWHIDEKTRRRHVELVVPAGTEAHIGPPHQKSLLVHKAGRHHWVE